MAACEDSGWISLLVLVMPTTLEVLFALVGAEVDGSEECWFAALKKCAKWLSVYWGIFSSLTANFLALASL